jgi:double-stranded RNA-binding protein Staufen
LVSPAPRHEYRRVILFFAFQEQAGNVEYGEGINPISRLIQIQQSKKQKEPEYTLVNEKGQGHARKKEFVVQVTCGEFKCEGVGNNKKMAKRAAADALLVAMGYAKPMPVPDKPAIKKPADDNDEANEEEG